MSIFSHIAGGIKGFATGGFGGAISGLIGGANNAPSPHTRKTGMSKAAVLPGAGMVATGVPTIASLGAGAVAAGRAALPVLSRLGSVAARGLPVVGSALVAGQLLYDAFGNPVGSQRRRRRMNPMNARAARRAIRRIKGARKMLQQIERQLPKQRVTSRSVSRQPARTEFIRQG